MISFQLAIRDRSFYEDILYVLKSTDNDFVPAISKKQTLENVADKYVNLAHVYLAYVNNVPVGFVSFYPNEFPETSYLSLIGVKSEYRGQEIGKNLELKCIEYCKKINSKGLRLNMRKSNIKLLESRLKLGYLITNEYIMEYSDELIVDLYLEF